MRWGNKESQALFEALRKDGHQHPAELQKPALRGDCIDYYDAFRFLGASRIWNQVGPQAIPISEINSYVKDSLGIRDLEERQKYIRLINRMDSVELNYLHEKRAAAASKK